MEQHCHSLCLRNLRKRRSIGSLCNSEYNFKSCGFSLVYKAHVGQAPSWVLDPHKGPVVPYYPTTCLSLLLLLLLLLLVILVVMVAAAAAVMSPYQCLYNINIFTTEVIMVALYLYLCLSPQPLCHILTLYLTGPLPLSIHLSLSLLSL